MIADAINKLHELFKAAQQPQVLKVPGIEREALVTTRESSEWKALPPADRKHQIVALDDFCDAMLDPEMAASPEVFVSPSAIVGLLKGQDRRETVTMPLQPTDRWKLLLQLAAQPRNMEPGEVVRMIRFDLQGIGADHLVGALSRVDFTRKNSGGATTLHGKESLGKEVEAQVQAAGEVPESFVARVRIWSNSGLSLVQAEVRCGIYLDVLKAGICIRPLADELETAMQISLGELRGLVLHKLPDVPVFRGSP